MHRNFNRIRHYSSGSDGSVEQDYGYSHNKEAVQNFQLMQEVLCIRCHKRVYPTEKVEIGVIMHKNCFKCLKCSVTLTLNSFVLARSVEGGPKDVFCKPHAPRLVTCSKDQDSMDIRNAVNAQRMHANFLNSQVRLPPGMERWEYDPKAMEFEHAKELHERNKLRRPKTHDGRADEFEYESGDLIRKLRDGMEDKPRVRDIATSLQDPKNRTKFPANSDYMEPNALWSPKAVEDPWNPNFYPGRSNGSQGGSSGHDSGFNEPIYAPLPGPLPGHEDPIYAPLPRHRDPSNMYDNGGSYGNHMAGGERIYESLNVIRKSEPPPSLPPRAPPPYKDRYRMADTAGEYYRPDHMMHRQGPRRIGYENVSLPPSGASNHPHHPGPAPHKAYFHDTAFLAQKDLENKQRQEQGELFRNFERLQEQEILELEGEIKRQMERAVDQLFMQMDSGMFQGDLNVEKLRIEQHFQQLKEEKMNSLLDRLNAQERIRVDDMIDKQTREMLQLIDKKVPTKLPSPEPPRKKKAQLYKDPQVFDDVDFTAMQVAKQEQGSISELVYDLTRNCKSQLEKARAIFRWITYKNLNQMIFTEDISEDSPYYFLKGIKYGLESYHELFKRLCSYAGLPVKIVRGVSKSAGYRPGQAFSESSSYKNTWSCLYIEDAWRFVDCHWGARHVTRPGDILDPSSFTYALDEFFFLTDPEDMIYMHLPDDPEWQLLERPKSREQFADLPVLKSHFFQYGLKLPTNAQAVINSPDGLAEVVLKRSGQDLPLAFNTRLEQDGEEIPGYCIHHSTDKEIVFNLSLPRRGVFYFTIFACDTDKSDAYNNICAFRIKCVHVKNKPFGRFPRLPDGYGPTPLAKDLGMTTEKYSEYYLVCNEEKMIMTIKFKTPVKISQKLVSGNDERPEEERKLDRYVFQRNRDHTFVSYLIHFPERGVYVFSVYAARKDNDSSVLEVAARYLIQCNARASAPIKPYPLTQAYWVKCRLHEPTTGDLKLNKNVKFKLEVHNADAVAVIVKQQWFYLKKEDNGKVWSGIAHTGKDMKANVDVYARLKDHERDFFPLLEYKLVDED